MRLKSFLLTVVCVFIATNSFAQANILNAKKPEDVGVRTEDQKKLDNDKPLEYGYVDDRDIMWSKMTWEIVDLDERANFHLYYPVDTNNIGSHRRSLFDVLMKSIQKGKIENIYDDSYFTAKRTLKDIGDAMTLIDTTDLGYEQYNAEGIVDQQFISRRDITAAEITEYHIKGLWYFDKRQGELKYRLLGISPVAPDVNFIDSDEPDMVELFWVWFPDARESLHAAKAFNNKNSSIPSSYDHLLNSRRFNAVIYKEENVYGDRQVKDYISENSLMQLLESDRIKEKIRNFEQDMWAY